MRRHKSCALATGVQTCALPIYLPAWSGFISAEGTYSDTTKKFDPQIAGQISWKDPEERLGFLVGVTYQERANRELRGSTETWRWWSDRDAAGNVLNPATDVNGNPFENDDAISYWPGGGVTAQGGNPYSGHWGPQTVNDQVFSTPPTT